MKKMVSTMLLIPFLVMGWTGQSLAASTLKLTVNGKEVVTEAPPTIIQGRTLVSLHSLQELNLLLNWNNTTKQVTVSSSDLPDMLRLTIGSKEALYGNHKRNLDVPAQLVNNRVYVPVRFISESFNSKVDWLPTSGTVSVTTGLNRANLEVLNKETNLVKARKLAYNLSSVNQPVLSNSRELSTNTLYFPEGEAHRYFHVWGNHIVYYEIKNSEKRLVWEAILTGEGAYAQEKGVRPSRGNEVYFESVRTTEGVQYGRTSNEEVFTGKKGSGTSLASLIQSVPNEVRTDIK